MFNTRAAIALTVGLAIVYTVVFTTTGYITVIDPSNPLVVLFGVWHTAAFLGLFCAWLTNRAASLVWAIFKG